MTTTVTVRTRALGAVVSTNGQETQVAARSEHSFHIEEGSQSFDVRQNTQEEQAQADTHEEQAEAEAAENPEPEQEVEQNQDQEAELLGRGRRARQPGDNRTGADETAQTTEE